MKCKYCEVEIAPKEKICHHCGRYLVEEKTEDEVTKKKRKRNMWIAVGSFGIVLAFVLTTFGGMMLTQKHTNENLQHQVAVSSANNLDMTFDQFKANFNQNDAAMQAKLNMGDIELTKGANDATFQYVASDKLVINGLVGKIDHKLLEVQMLGVPGSTKDEQRRFILTIGALIDLFSPELYEDERGTILKELGFDKNADLSKANNTVVRGNVKYTFRLVKDVGFVLSIRNVNRQ